MKIDTIFSKAGISIITEPYLVGNELGTLSKKASEDWIRSLDLSQISNPVSLEILNGGHYYFAADAYKSVTNKPCQVSTLRARRGQTSTTSDDDKKSWPSDTVMWKSKKSDWFVRLWEKSEFKAGPLLVGDTIATGTTLAGVLGYYVNQMISHEEVHNIYIFTIAGASSWEHGGKAKSFIEKMESLDALLSKYGKKIHITYCNAQFCLQKNGTDLAFVDAKFHPQSASLIKAKIPEEFWPSMRCAVWDWGDRFTKINHHLEEIKEWFMEQKNCPESIMQGINKRLSMHKSKLETRMIQEGDILPNGILSQVTDKGMIKHSISTLFSGKKVVLFAVPGAFTPTCSERHLPGYVSMADSFKEKGVDTIACIAVNDAFVMKAWGKAQKANNLMMLSDGDASFTKTLGLEMNTVGFGGIRSKRYAMVIDDLMVTKLNIEEPKSFKVSKAEFILSKL